jgi:Tol biopolymer transport system component
MILSAHFKRCASLVIFIALAGCSSATETVPTATRPAPTATRAPATVEPTAQASPTVQSEVPGQVLRIPSPDEKWVAIIERRTGGLDLVDPSGAVKEVFPPGSGASSLKWSPDSRHLIYWPWELSASIQADGLPLFILDVQDGSVRQVAETTLLNLHYQSWSPDGSALVFTNGGYRSAQVDKWLALYDVESGVTKTLVSQDELVPGAVAWSPRGDWIAFAAIPAQQTGPEWADWMAWDNPAIAGRRIYLLDPARGEYQRLNGVEAYQDAPAWDEAGQTLYYVQRAGEWIILVSVDIPGGKPQTVEGCQAPLPPGAGYYGQPDWGELLACRKK